VGADAKLSLAEGIPIHVPDHVVLLKPNIVDLASSVASESPSVHVQPSAPAPSIAPTTVAPSGTRPVIARVITPPGTTDPRDLFHIYPKEVVRLSFEAS
jgi:hypothetical protein